MSDDEKPVPEPGEVERDGDEVFYHRVDETNVGEADRSDQPEPEPPEDED
jgi:hypothetical protein